LIDGPPAAPPQSLTFAGAGETTVGNPSSPPENKRRHDERSQRTYGLVVTRRDRET